MNEIELNATAYSPSASGGSKYYLAINIALLIAFMFIPLTLYADTETSQFKIVQKAYAANDPDREKLSASFLKKFSKSRYVPDVRLLQAEDESDPEAALTKYRAIISNYRYFARKDYASLRICETLNLLARWEELHEASSTALKRFPESAYTASLRLFLIISAINTGRFSEAERECEILTQENRGYDDLAKTLVIMSYIVKNESGNSREYISRLRELAIGFNASKSYPTALYLLGEFYESRKDFDRAYSAYADVSSMFPKSPEAALSLDKIEKLKRHNPKKAEYLPKQDTVKNTDSIDIKPEHDLDIGDTDIYYSISIGTFSKQAEAGEIKKIAAKIADTRIVKLKAGYIVYMGRFRSQDEVMAAKVRLAEEYGINGRIVRVSSDKKREYIYGE